MYEDDKENRYKMANAWMRMCKNKDGQHVSSHEFELARKAYIISIDHDKRSLNAKCYWEENKDKRIGENHPGFGKHLSLKIRQKIADKLKGKHHSEETRAKIAAANIGKKHKSFSKEACDKISKALRGNVPWNKGIFLVANVGKHWWNNGFVNGFFKECPGKGWVRGRIKEKKLK